MSSVSHTSNANESTLPLSNQWDSAVREQKIEKEFRSNSDTGRNICYIDEELKALHTKAHKMKSELYKPSSALHKKGSDSGENKSPTNLSEKLLAYLKLQNHPSQQQLSMPTSQSPVVKRKLSIGEKTGLKAYKADIQFPQSTKNSRSNKASATMLSSQASSTKNSARGKDSKKAHDIHVTNFSPRNPVISSQGNSASVQKILWRKLSDQMDKKNKIDIQSLERPGILTSPSSRNTDRTNKKRLSNPSEIQEMDQANKMQKAKKSAGASEIHEARASPTQETEKLSSAEGLLALVGRIDSILLRYEKEEMRLRQKNNALLRLLDQKITEKNAAKNLKAK